ncbi:MAG TPA: CHAD domain-containing protein, partial [Planctomycetaceae bacterium]
VLRPALAERLGASAGDGCESGRLEVFAGEMRDLLARIESWRIDAHGFDAVRDGLAETYRRARRAMRHARKTGDDADRHEWRKQAKYHWYHVRLLRNVWKPEMDARRGELDRLSDLLGDDHDLAVLRETAAGLPGLRAGDLGPLLSLVDRRRSALQAAAYPLGERLFAEKPSAFAKRMRRYWKVWRE